MPPSTENFVEKDLPFDIDELDAIRYYSDQESKMKNKRRA